ncbi:YdcF family protein [Microbacterium sp.]|uniref:YdcF family protein n=1 Tax=Microbacterium sp. TaxID=51671 RepID=UPI003C745E56
MTDERPAPPRRRRRILRRLAIIAVAAVLAGAAIVAAGAPVYVFPYADDVDSADVAFVVGPPTNQRINAALRLHDRGVVERVLISVAEKGVHSADELDACNESFVTCEHPDPYTTAGEAKMLDEFAPGARAVVITYTPHVSRTRYIFEQCFSGETFVDPVRRNLSMAQWAYQYAYQSLAFVKAWVTGCA